MVILSGTPFSVKCDKKNEFRLRPYDAIGRYGGEEFIIVFPRCRKPNATGIAEESAARFQYNPISEGRLSCNIHNSQHRCFRNLAIEES